MLSKFLKCEAGAFVVQASILAVPLLMTVGIAVDVARMYSAKTELQNAADAAALDAVRNSVQSKSGLEKRAKQFFLGNSSTAEQMKHLDFKAEMVTPTRVRVKAQGAIPPMFMQLGGYPKLDVAIVSEAEIATGGSGACVTVLSNTPQALLLNSGAAISAPKCEMHVHSQANPAFIHNAAVNLDMAKLCVKGTKYINNGSPLTELEPGCNAAADPYAGAFKEPSLPSGCSSSGVLASGNHVLDPGMHCGTIVHSGSKVTFKPGLHIIKDSMIFDASASIVAKDVTFYFPDTNSEIRANGGLTFTASAPTSGAYKGVLMFEKTSDPGNNAKKRQYVFNGSINEQLEGIVYLPNRDVTYNSTTKVSASKINMVVNTMIVNSANWQFESYDGSGPSNGTSGPRLVN